MVILNFHKKQKKKKEQLTDKKQKQKKNTPFLLCWENDCWTPEAWES